MAVELECTLVKSPPELWDELASEPGLRRWLGDVRVSAADPPCRLEWASEVATGVIELEASGWGTKVRAHAKPNHVPAWDRLREGYDLERSLRRLMDDLGSSSLTGS
jgi:hypothetical protein